MEGTLDVHTSYVQGGNGLRNGTRRKDPRWAVHNERQRITNHSLHGSGRRREVFHRKRRKIYQEKVSKIYRKTESGGFQVPTADTYMTSIAVEALFVIFAF